MIEFGEQVPKIHKLCYLLIENIVKSKIMRKLEIVRKFHNFNS